MHGCDWVRIYLRSKNSNWNNLYWVSPICSIKVDHKHASFLGSSIFSRDSFSFRLSVVKILGWRSKWIDKQCDANNHIFDNNDIGNNIFDIGRKCEQRVHFLLFWQKVQGIRVIDSQHAGWDQSRIGKCELWG